MTAQYQPTQINVSTTFFPSAVHPGVRGAADLVLCSSNTVFFYVHSTVLAAKSSNDFAGLLSATLYTQFQQQQANEAEQIVGKPTNLPAITVQESSDILNIICHIIYSLPCSRYAPSLEVIHDAIVSLSQYGLDPPPSTSDVWDLLLRHATAHPIRAYAVAATVANEAACVTISQHTLTVPIHTTREDEAMIMGPAYFKRLANLHFARDRAARRILAIYPVDHPSVRHCSNEKKARSRRAWGAGVREILLNPIVTNLSSSQITDVFGPIAMHAECSTCKASMQTRITGVIAEWDGIKQTV